MKNVTLFIWKNLSAVQEYLNKVSFDEFKQIFNIFPGDADDYLRYDCIKQWIENDITERKQYFGEFMDSFDFQKMLNAHLRLIIVDNLMKDHPKFRELIIERLCEISCQLDDINIKAKTKETVKLGRIKCTYKNVKDTSYHLSLSNNEYNAKIIGGSPWTVVAYKTFADGVDWLSFNIKSNCSCTSRLIYRLCSNEKNFDIIREVDSQIFPSESFGYTKFIRWEDLMNKRSGFLSRHGKITLQMDIEVVK